MAKKHRKKCSPSLGHKGNANQNHTKIHLILTNVDEDTGKKETSYTADGKQ
jgi:hypothetical protein